MARTDYGAILSTVIKDTSDAIREVNGTSALIAPNAWGANIRTMKSADDYENVLDQLVQEEVASAPVASFSDGANDIPLKELSLSINPTQSGSGDPYPAGGGKNKSKVATWSGHSGTVQVLDKNIPANTQFTFSGLFNRTPDTAGLCAIIFNFEDGTQSGWYNINVNRTTRQHETVTFAKEVKSLSYYSHSGGWSASQSYTLTVTDFQIEFGATATDYAPYSNIRPITGVSSVKVTRTGASIVEVSDKTGSINNGYFYSFTTGYTLQADVTYTLTMVVNTTVEPFAISVGVGDGSSYRADIAYTEIVNRNGVVSITFTPTSANLQNWNVLWFRAPRYSTPQELHPTTCTFTITNISLVTSVDTYTIQLGDTYYGATLDVVRGKLVCNTGFLSWNGSDNWSSDTQSGNPVMKIARPSGIKISDMMICSHAVRTSNSSQIYSGYYFVGNSNILFGYSGTLAEWQTLLNSDNLQIRYELATPIEIDLTPTQINSLLGSNNIWHDGNGDTSCTYYANGQLYVDQHST